ncbi:FAD-binding domain-containing protein [Salix suchowensis]|nr:FAD-binding domain-containing protein [Salix suchowensis]
MISGAIALVAFTVATFISFRPIRNAAFEFFLISHIVLVAFGAYFWSGLVVWAADRVLRFCRILWNNRGGNATKATVELLAEDTTRVTIRRRMNWTPGQHAYLIFPTVSKLPSEAHPFTIASIPTTIEGTSERELVFLIGGQGGFTRRLQQHVTSSSSEPVPVYIDGPYGNPPNLHVFSTSILIAAHLTWITEIITKALSVAPPCLSIEPRIYVTGRNYPIPKVPALQSDGSTSSSTSSLPSELTSQDLPQYSALKLLPGRPSMKKLLQDEINSALGPVSVDVAGPSALSHSVRRVLADVPASPSAALKGTPDVTLHVETFGMVKT